MRDSTSPHHAIAAALGVAATFDAADETGQRVQFLVDRLAATRTKALVLGISGGVDSTTTGRLCQLAVERSRAAGHLAQFVAMRLPYGQQRDADDAERALDFIRPDLALRVDIAPAVDAMVDALTAAGFSLGDPAAHDFAVGNVKARQRMIAQYAVANALNGLVVGTDHAAEAVMGFFTKHGDGACDVAPLSGLTKRRVRAIAAHLGAPRALVGKVPTADLESLRPLRPDEAALGVSYEEIDDFLEGKPVPTQAAAKIVATYERTAHKRTMPAVPD
ncbi:MAG TPA: ammonia-dependent NAD(+) synthetase [Candidatus Saccharimonadia bacterium]|nr:ammonia-dependent NAD(+) synthetase [Candidatus Saccharimonadia bacterium]